MTRRRAMKRGRIVDVAGRTSGLSPTLSWLLALSTLACCAGHPLAARPGPAPTADQLLSVLATRQGALRSMNARARATSWMGGERLRATVLMLVERHGSMRIEAEVSLQGTVSILTTQAARFELLDVRSNRLQRGPACPENVASLVRIPLLPDEVAAILLGDVKLPPGGASGAGNASVAWDAARGADVLVIQDGAIERRVFFAPGGGRGEVGEIWGAAAATAAGPLWRTSYEDFADAGGGLRLPGMIRFAERGGSFDDGVEIKFKDRSVNVEVPDASFVISPPPGSQVIEVGCGAPGAASAR